MLTRRVRDWWLVPGFSAETRTVLALMDTDPPNALKYIMDKAIRDLVRNGDFVNIIQLLVVLDTFNNSLTDWKGNQDAIAVLSPVFDAYDSIAFNGTTNYVDTQITANARDNNYVGLYVNDASSAGGTRNAFGARSAGRRINVFQEGGSVKFENYAGSPLVGAAGDILADSYYSNRRSASDARELRKNGIQLAGDADVSTGTIVRQIWIGGQNNGVIQNPWDGSMSLYVSGNKDIDDAFVYATFKTMIDDIRALG